MAPKKDASKKGATNSGKKGISAKPSQSSRESTTVKREKIAFSFTANANLNDGASTSPGSEIVWISKLSMIKCGLSYEDTVIVQTIVDGVRAFMSNRIRLL